MIYIVSISIVMIFIIPSQTSSIFPIKDCDNPDKEFLIVLDCRHDLREQIYQFSKTAIGYLRTGRKWGNFPVKYIINTKNGLIQLSQTNYVALNSSVDELENNCTGEVSIDNIFNRTRNFFLLKSNTIQISFIMLGQNISNTVDDQQSVESIADRQDKEREVKRFFVIVAPDKRDFVVKDYILYTPSFQQTNLYDYFLKVCDAKCTLKAINYTEDDNFRSYYHFKRFAMANKTFGEHYCHSEFNSYLISLESFQEMRFLESNLTKYNKDGEIKVILGLQKRSGNVDISWASENPFIMLWANISKYFTDAKEACAYLRLKGGGNANIDVKAFNCDDNIDDVYLACECHVVQPNDIRKDVYFLTNNQTPTYSLVPSKSVIHEIKKLLLPQDSTEYAPDTRATIQTFQCDSNRDKELNNLKAYVCHIETYNVNNQSKLSSEDIKYTMLEISHHNKLDSYYNYFLSARSLTEKVENNSSSIFEQYYIKCDDTIYAPRCIFAKSGSNFQLHACSFNLHLLNCTNFTCPAGYFKCPKSYCIPLYQVNDGVKDCPRGEDENVIFKTNNPQCTGHMVLKAYDMCLETDVWDQLHSDIFYHISANNKYMQYICKVPCSDNFHCFSSVTKDKNGKSSLFSFTTISLSSPFFKISDILIPHSKTVYILTLFKPIELRLPDCGVNDFDLELQKFDKSELLVLDLSRNQITTSQQLNQISKLAQLRLLNLSYNQEFDIHEDFTFPSSLQIVDVSNTKIERMPKNAFQNLTELKHVNLSYTRISSFDEFGIPENFKLKSLDIRGLEIKKIHRKYFKNLEIEEILLASDYRLCCPAILEPNIPSDKCQAPSDAISTCQHLVGDTLKRVIIWIVGFITIFGNGFVLVYRLTWDTTKKHNTTQIFFVICLAVSDFIMGIYLVIIASADIYFTNEYVLQESDWRYGELCRFSGFLSTISSETSTFFICWITYDRYTAMTKKCGLHKMSKKMKYFAFMSSWILGFVLALIPAVFSEWEIYSSNGMCLALPLNTGRFKGWEYSFAVFVILNFVLFLFIAAGQVAIFFIIVKSKRNLQGTVHGNVCNREISAAQKLALVAISDFLCWFPIGIMGMFSLGGYTYNIDVYAWVAIFILPINSAVNPLLYTIPEIYTLLTKKTMSQSQYVHSRRERVELVPLQE